MGGYFSQEGNGLVNVDETTTTEDQTDIDFTQIKDINQLVKLKRAKDARKEANKSKYRDVTKENQLILKKLFKKLDPTVARVATDFQGEIQISLKYDFKSENLLVKIIKVRDLGVNSITGRSCSPYVELSLYPDENEAGTKHTGISQKSQNPIFNEIFAFSMDEVALMNARLIIKVINFDVMDDDEFLGEAIINMTDLHFQDSPVHTAWYSLEPEVDVTLSGDLDVSLDFTFPQTLSVNVNQASGLQIATGFKAIVKVSVPGIDYVGLTQAVTSGEIFVWDESFTFEVPIEEFTLRHVVFTVLTEGDDENGLLGHAVIDLDNFNHETGMLTTLPLSDMSHSDRLKNKWFQSTTVQELKEALWAHSYFQYPSSIFQNHTGNKVLRLRCRKAGAQGKINFVNGIPV